MSKLIKKIPIKEFRSFGFLQEVNRQFFHPLGLALEVNIDEVTGEESLGGIWDYRGGPAGLEYGVGVLDRDKYERVRNLKEEKYPSRQKIFGFAIQRVPKYRTARI